MKKYNKDEIANAYYILAKCFQEGNVVEQDEFQAFSYYEKAARLGNVCAAMILGEYFRKQGNKEKSFEWFLMVSEGEEEENVNALYYLGTFYEEGWKPVEKNLTAAYRYYEKAAKLGHEKAKMKMKYQKFNIMKDAVAGWLL